MAIAYFRASICGGGSSPVAAAAYQAAQNLHDETDNREKNYTHKEEVVAAGIELPENAPADFADREKLWNAVQRFENAQKNSSKQPPQYARKLVIALPDELTTAQKIGAAEDLAQFFAQQGMCADCVNIYFDTVSRQGSAKPTAQRLGLYGVSAITLEPRRGQIVELPPPAQRRAKWVSRGLALWRGRWGSAPKPPSGAPGSPEKIFCDHTILLV